MTTSPREFDRIAGDVTAIRADIHRIADAAERPSAESRALDTIALMMRNNDWDADLSTAIADVVGTVRPHPGDQAGLPPVKPKPSQQQIIDMGCDELEEAMPPYMLAHFRGDHLYCPPAECRYGERQRREIGQARVMVQDRVPVRSIEDTVVAWNADAGGTLERLVDLLVEREETIGEYLIGAAGVRGPELRGSTIAVMRDAGMEVNEDAL